MLGMLLTNNGASSLGLVRILIDIPFWSKPKHTGILKAGEGLSKGVRVVCRTIFISLSPPSFLLPTTPQKTLFAKNKKKPASSGMAQSGR